jgi:hypothetical protein
MMAGVTPTRRHVLASPTALIAVIVTGALAAVAGAWVARIAAPAEPEHPPVRVVSVGPARLVVSSDWQPASLTSAGIAGLDAARAVAFDPAPGLSTRVVATFAPGAEPSLIPADLRSALSGPPPAPERTRLGRWPAWLYRDLLVSRSGRRADVTVLATTAGVLAVACTTRAGSTADLGCSPGVESVTVPGAATLIPSRSLALALRLPTVLDRLNGARSTDRTTLRAARTGASQALAARRLGADHRAAAHALRIVGGPAAAPLTRALSDVAAAYDTLSRAAQEASPAEFASAVTGIKRAEAVLASGVADVARPGMAPIAHARSAAPARQGQDSQASGGVSAIVSVLLIALAVAAGAATGSSGTATRLTTRRTRSV